jgi:hypothetical protein
MRKTVTIEMDEREYRNYCWHRAYNQNRERWNKEFTNVPVYLGFGWIELKIRNILFEFQLRDYQGWGVYLDDIGARKLTDVEDKLLPLLWRFEHPNKSPQ